MTWWLRWIAERWVDYIMWHVRRYPKGGSVWLPIRLQKYVLEAMKQRAMRKD